MRSEDPYGTLEFVEFGRERGEVRIDVDIETITSMLDWVAERIQDALVSEDLDPGLVHRRPHLPERRAARIAEVTLLLRSGFAAASGSPGGPPRRALTWGFGSLSALPDRVRRRPPGSPIGTSGRGRLRRA